MPNLYLSDHPRQRAEIGWGRTDRRRSDESVAASPLPLTEQQQATVYNQAVANQYTQQKQMPVVGASDAANLTQGFVPFRNQGGAWQQGTFAGQYDPNAFASLQKDTRFGNLSDEVQESVLRARGGENAVRQWQTARTLDLLKQKQQLSMMEDLGKRKLDLQLAPMTRIKDMLSRGDMRVSPGGQGFELKGKNAAGIEEWQPADPYTTRDAINTWGYLYPGEAPPVNPKMLQQLSELRARGGPEEKKVVAAPTEQQRATTYNQGVANLQTQAPGVGMANAIKGLFGQLGERAPAGYGLPGQSLGGAAVLDTSSRVLSGASNALTGVFNMARGGANFLNQFSPFGPGQPYPQIPPTTPEQIQRYFYDMGSNAQPAQSNEMPAWLSQGLPQTTWRPNRNLMNE